MQKNIIVKFFQFQQLEFYGLFRISDIGAKPSKIHTSWYKPLRTGVDRHKSDVA